MRPINRFNPALPVNKVKTYSVRTPTSTHTRPATCTEVDCPTQAGGWTTSVDETTDLGKRQAHYIRTQAGRPYTETLEAGITVFRFPPGAECFATHRVSLDRPALHVVRGGDWRAATSRPVEMRPEDWLDDFANHQDALARAQT